MDLLKLAFWYAFLCAILLNLAAASPSPSPKNKKSGRRNRNKSKRLKNKKKTDFPTNFLASTAPKNCCKNAGICVLGSFCYCPETFYGRHCEFQMLHRPCGPYAMPHGSWYRKGCDLCLCVDSKEVCSPRLYGGCATSGSTSGATPPGFRRPNEEPRENLSEAELRLEKELTSESKSAAASMASPKTAETAASAASGASGVSAETTASAVSTETTALAVSAGSAETTALTESTASTLSASSDRKTFPSKKKRKRKKKERKSRRRAPEKSASKADNGAGRRRQSTEQPQLLFIVEMEDQKSGTAYGVSFDAVAIWNAALAAMAVLWIQRR